LVKGVPITRYCDEHRLTPRQRLELFIPVCQALQHAHQKGIIHRDLTFAADVQRYLADEPVLACPPSAWYRFRKFLRRNTGPVLAAGVMVFVRRGGIAGPTSGLVLALAAEGQAVTERDEKEDARRQTRQALDTMTDEVVEDLMGQEGVQLTDKRRDSDLFV